MKAEITTRPNGQDFVMFYEGEDYIGSALGKLEIEQSKFGQRIMMSGPGFSFSLLCKEVDDQRFSQTIAKLYAKCPPIAEIHVVCPTKEG